jgi:heavy metal sensor kinase
VKSLSIRWRLTAYTTAFMLLILIGMSSLVLWRVQQHLLKRADQSLADEISELVEELQFFDDREMLVAELQRRYSVHSHYYFQVLDEQLSTVFQSRFLTNVALPAVQAPGTMRGKQFANIELPGLGNFRLLNMAIRDQSAKPMMLRVLSSRADLDRDFQSYVWMFFTLVPIAVLSALTVGYFLAGNLLAPIKRINATVKKITANRLTERLPVLNANDELGELAGALNDTFDRLQKSIDSMRRFTSDAAHELRSPVAVIRTETEIALRKPRSAAEYRRVVQSTFDETTRLGAMLDHLLTLSRHDSGVQPLSREEVPIGAVLQDVVTRCEPLAQDKGLVLDTQQIPNCFVLGHDVWLSQLFFNLIENAIKFTPAQVGRVTVSGRSHGKVVEFQIADNGIGIAAEHIPLVFERFYRSDKSREHYRGTGLGLSICKSIVEAHQGSIEMQSHLGQGTTVTVELPMMPMEADCCEPTATPSPSSVPYELPS